LRLPNMQHALVRGKTHITPS